MRNWRKAVGNAVGSRQNGEHARTAERLRHID